MAEAAEAVAGTITTVGPNLACRIRLDLGAEVAACIPRRTARHMFRVVPGDRVRVQADGDGFIVLGHERVNAEQTVAGDGLPPGGMAAPEQ
jgi:translation initiation factor IF-1